MENCKLKESDLYLMASQLVALWKHAAIEQGVDWDTFSPAMECLVEAVEEIENN